MNHKSFGECLKEIRLSKNITQKSISEQLHISRQAYSNYEQGRCTPSPQTLAHLSFLLEENLFLLLCNPYLSNQTTSPQYYNVYKSNKEFTMLYNLFSNMSKESQRKLINYMKNNQCEKVK